MGDPDRISRGDWETILHAPFHAYRLVAAADDEPTEAQFRRLSDEIRAAVGHFSEGTIGRTMADTLSANLDAFWAAAHAGGRSPKDGLKGMKRALRNAPDGEAEAIRDWLVDLAVRIAEARHDLGGAAVSPAEAHAIGEIAGWVDRSRPDLPRG